MPIYEYQCEQCGIKFQKLVHSSAEQGQILCPQCGSEQVHKAISLFGLGGGSRGGQTNSCSSGPV